MSAFTPEQNDRFSSAVQTETKRAHAAAREGKRLLDGMKQKKQRLQAEGAQDTGRDTGAELRLQANQYMQLVKQYMEAVSEHQLAKANFKEVCVDKAVQQAKAVFEGVDEEELAERVERDPTAIQQALTAPTVEANEQVQAAYDEAMSRAKDVEALVVSLNEVASMVQDLATIVQEQSELLDRIDVNVEDAGTHVKKGNMELEKAIRYQKKARKRFCCIIIICAVLLVIGLGVGIPIGGN